MEPVKTKKKRRKKKNVSLGFAGAFSETTPLTAAETQRCARNTRKTSNPLWLRVFIPQQCLSIFKTKKENSAFIVLGRDLHVLVGVDEEPA